MNPYAPPFRPMYQVPQPQQQGFQQQIMAQQNIPPPQTQQQNTLSHELLEKMYSHPNAAALFEIQIGLEQLVYESHEYDIWANAIRDRLMGPDIQSEDINIAMEIIIEMAVTMNNCQYNFSKLCQFLNGCIHTFALVCLVPCLNEFACNHSSEYSGYRLLDQELQNFVLFLAELYDKVELNGVRLSQIAALLFDQLNVLLKYEPTHDALVKTVIQVLKLVGRFLEADQGPRPLDEIFNAINALCFKAKELSESVKGQILALFQLRQNEWGVCNITEQPASSSGITSQHAGNNGASSSSSILIMGPDGKPLTEEEYAFLEENCGFGGSNSPSGSWNEALEDDDVLEDYEKFLQATAIRAAEKALEKLSFEDDEVESIASGSFNNMTGGSFAASSPKKVPANKSSTASTSNNIFIVRKEKRTDNSANLLSNCPSDTTATVNEAGDYASNNKQ